MSLDDISNMHLQTINSSWDYYPDAIHSINDIDIEKVNNFIKRYEEKHNTKVDYQPLEFLNLKNILRDNKLTFGAYLLFVKNGSFVSDIQIGRFKTDITIIDTISINDDLFTQLDKIMAFIKKHLMVELIITGNPQHTERYDYPLDAIREIVINMLVHRDYRSSNGSIIKIYDNRIEFYNPGGLYGDLTLDNLLKFKYSSQTRNKLIADAFKEIGIIEKYGSGIKRIFTICKNYGVIPPIINANKNSFEFVLFKEQLSDGLSDGLNDGLNDRQKLTLEEIRKNPGIKVKELSDKLGIPIDTLDRYIRIFVKRNLIERRGSKKTGGYYAL